MQIQFHVFGSPVPQGSTRVVPLKAKGGGYQMRPDGRPKLLPIHQHDRRLKSWRQDVANAARAVYDGPLLDGPVKLSILFILPRPQGHFGSGRNAGKLKDSAPIYPTRRPDLVKLTRGIEDALTGVLWRDDSQIVKQELEKTFGDCAMLTVLLETL